MTRTDLNLVCLTLSLFLIALAGLGIALRRLKLPQLPLLLIFGSYMLGWLVTSAIVAMNTKPPPITEIPVGIIWLLLSTLLGALAVALSPIGRRLAQGLRWRELVIFQAFRLPVELILYGYFFEARVPLRMTMAGSNYDIVAALSALVLGVLLWRGVLGVGAVWLWNFLGLGLLVNIVVLAVLSLPGGLERFQIGLVNTLPFQWPSVWILFSVQTALLGHLILVRKLTSARKSE